MRFGRRLLLTLVPPVSGICVVALHWGLSHHLQALRSILSTDSGKFGWHRQSLAGLKPVGVGWGAQAVSATSLISGFVASSIRTAS